jgi:osmotically-inducible protein OsmY
MHLRGKVDSGEAKAAAAEIATGIDAAKSVTRARPRRERSWSST